MKHKISAWTIIRVIALLPIGYMVYLESGIFTAILLICIAYQAMVIIACLKRLKEVR